MPRKKPTATLTVHGKTPEHLKSKVELLLGLMEHVDATDLDIEPKNRKVKHAYTIATNLGGLLVDAMLRDDFEDGASLLKFWHELTGDRFYETIEPRRISLKALLPPAKFKLFEQLRARFHNLSETEERVLSLLSCLPTGQTMTSQAIANALDVSHDHVRRNLLSTKGMLRMRGYVDKKVSRGFFATGEQTSLELPE